MGEEHRKWGPCVVCVALGDEEDKKIHGLNMCEKHYKAHLRKRNIDPDGNLDEDRHADRQREAHQFVAEKFQKFLHVLNHKKVKTVLPPVQVHEIRLLVTPPMVRSQRIAVPRSLPNDMLHENPLDIIADSGDSPLENSVGTVPSEIDRRYLNAKAREVGETITQEKRERSNVAFEIIEAGYNALLDKYPSGEDFALLAAAHRLLRSLLGEVDK